MKRCARMWSLGAVLLFRAASVPALSMDYSYRLCGSCASGPLGAIVRRWHPSALRGRRYCRPPRLAARASCYGATGRKGGFPHRSDLAQSVLAVAQSVAIDTGAVEEPGGFRHGGARQTLPCAPVFRRARLTPRYRPIRRAASRIGGAKFALPRQVPPQPRLSRHPQRFPAIRPQS